MKVFISWSKDRSREIATIFSKWLPRVIQECSDPFISTETVKGDPWFATITGELENSKVGIVFITPENQDESWLNFEAGALLTKFGKQRVCPVLVGMKKADYSGPLKNLQLTELADRDDAFKLITAINAACERPLTDDVLASAFESQWGTLEEGLSSSHAHAPVATKPKRTLDDKIDEVLETVRGMARDQRLAQETYPGQFIDEGEAYMSSHARLYSENRLRESPNALRHGGTQPGRASDKAYFKELKREELEEEARLEAAMEANRDELRARLENGDY